MPFPATRHALPHGGTTGRQRPRCAACADTQVCGMLRIGQSPHRQAGHRLRADIQCRIIPALLGAVAQAPSARQAFGVGQRPIPPRPCAPALVARAPHTPDAVVQAAIQSRTQSDRKGLEADAPIGYHNRHFPTLEDIMHAVRERFAIWEQSNRQLVRLCAII